MEPYLSPRPLRCWPISLTMSLSVWDITVTGDILSESPWSSPFCVEQPFRADVEAWSAPLCWQPFACIMSRGEKHCFFRGGDPTPPSSLSDEDASLAVLQLLYFKHKNTPINITKRHQKYTKCSTQMTLSSPFILLRDVICAVHRLMGNSDTVQKLLKTLKFGNEIGAYVYSI